MSTEPTRPPKYKRCRRDNEPGHAHALTFSCFRRQPFLARERACRWTLDAIDRARERHGFDVWAFVLMPEHVHLLIRPRSARYDISAILTSLKTSVSRRAVPFVRRHAPGFLPRMTDTRPDGHSVIRFWQRGGGYDRNLWDAGYIWQTIDYIHANPVRRGLCERPADWPWSSARAHLDRSAEPLTLDWHTLPDDPRPE